MEFVSKYKVNIPDGTYNGCMLGYYVNAFTGKGIVRFETVDGLRNIFAVSCEIVVNKKVARVCIKESGYP